jgi:type VI secretion system protein ImpA
MSARWEIEDWLFEPIAADRPCGDNLEDTELLASFDTYRLFGQSRPLDTPADRDEKRIPKPPESYEWIEIRDKASEALRKSKDLRLLVHLGVALLRTDGVPGFASSLDVASRWLETYWNQLYPLVDEDAMQRRNALSCFGDPMAVVDALRRLPLVSSRQHGTFSLRDIELASREAAPGDGEVSVDRNRITAAFNSMPLAALTELQSSVTGAVASLRTIDATMREAAGTDATPNFELLSAQFARLGHALRTQLASRPDAAAAPTDQAAPEAVPSEALATNGIVKSRQDAIRALDAVAAFFRRTEPSSPIPLFVERAKRLVSKDFLEVLADVAPDALPQARAAGGLKQGE